MQQDPLPPAGRCGRKYSCMFNFLCTAVLAVLFGLAGFCSYAEWDKFKRLISEGESRQHKLLETQIILADALREMKQEIDAAREREKDFLTKLAPRLEKLEQTANSGADDFKRFMEKAEAQNKSQQHNFENAQKHQREQAARISRAVLRLIKFIDIKSHMLNTGVTFEQFDRPAWRAKRHEIYRRMDTSESVAVIYDKEGQRLARRHVQEPGKYYVDGIEAYMFDQHDFKNNKINIISLKAPALAAAGSPSVRINGDASLDGVLLDGCLTWEKLEPAGEYDVWQATDIRDVKRTTYVRQGLHVKKENACLSDYLARYELDAIRQDLSAMLHAATEGEIGRCFVFGACVDGSDSLFFEDGQMIHKHHRFTDLGQHITCPAEYKFPQGGFLINGNHKNLGEPVTLPYSRIKNLRSIKGRGTVTVHDGKHIHIDDDRYGAADVYEIEICGDMPGEL